eukprot:985138_1
METHYLLSDLIMASLLDALYLLLDALYLLYLLLDLILASQLSVHRLVVQMETHYLLLDLMLASQLSVHRLVVQMETHYLLLNLMLTSMVGFAVTIGLCGGCRALAVQTVQMR